jgi:hypothetical protein
MNSINNNLNKGIIILVTFNRSLVLLVTDILQGAVLQPVLDLLPDPDHCINYLIAEAFHPGPSRKFPEPSGKYVPMLENFVSNHLDSRQSVSVKDIAKS